MSSVETGQMSAVEAGQMSAAETGQMSADETRQMSSVARTDICLVSAHNVEVSEVSTVPMLKSQKSQLWQCHSVQVSDRRSGPKSAKSSEMDPEWSPGRENRSPGMPRPFSRLWHRSAAQNRQNISQTPDQPPPAAATCLFSPF